MMRHARTRMAAIPSALWILLAMTTVLAFAWAILLPPFQGPDEESHFNYTQQIVEKRTIPWKPTGTLAPGARQGVGTELGVALGESGDTALVGNLADRANWTAVDEDIWRDLNSTLPDIAKSNGGYLPAMRNPPLYYLYASVPYAITSGASIWTRELAVRLFGIPLLLGTVVFAWLIAGEVFRRRRWLQVTAAGVVALDAQLVHLSSVVNPDAMLALLGSAVLYLSVVLLRHGLTRGRVAWMVAVAVACAATHPRGLSICGAGLLAIAIAAWRSTGPHTPRAARRMKLASWALGILGVAVLTVLAAGSPSPGAMRQFGSYLWQFYLPKLGFMDPSIRPDYGARQAFVERFFGTYAQLDTVLSRDVLDLIWTGVRVGLVLFLASLVVQRRSVRANLDVVAVLGFALLFYLGVNHVLAYRALRTNPLDPVLTGRYLLPLIALMGLAVATVVRALPRTAGAVATSAALSLAVLLQFAALGAVVVRFYG
ncbi:hypothetical protein [Conexibacter sp. CPCC 206217]|uniref:hypothetical protein n=1 Tax=Conexibacter sp. CPCC 206217 TaxID=3064574 RepID=UPI0027160CD2|nr:hypothetical protein [Conexibacter sp. CPCC 206217]MDO8210008.1 hypothetical protein [Conexibacter sp. CPCC 206217]